MCVGVITIDTVALVDKYPSEDERVLATELGKAIATEDEVVTVEELIEI